MKSPLPDTGKFKWALCNLKVSQSEAVFKSDVRF